MNHWSAFDNFEWNLGLSYRFGLVGVNRYTKERRMTEAGTFYAEICKENKVDTEKKILPPDEVMEPKK